MRQCFSYTGTNANAAGVGVAIVFDQGNADPNDDRFGLFGHTLVSEGVSRGGTASVNCSNSASTAACTTVRPLTARLVISGALRRRSR